MARVKKKKVTHSFSYQYCSKNGHGKQVALNTYRIIICDDLWYKIVKDIIKVPITNNQIKLVEKFAKETMAGFRFDHNFDHTKRVLKTARKIAHDEKGVDLLVLETACLLHDIGYGPNLSDDGDHALVGAKIAEKYLKSICLDDEKVKAVCHAIRAHRFRTKEKPKTIEAKILFDADKIDSEGAIGIVRGIYYLTKSDADLLAPFDDKYIKNNLGGSHNGRLFDRSKHSIFRHFETKGKHLLNFLYSDSGRRIAKKHLKFSHKFVEELKKDIS